MEVVETIALITINATVVFQLLSFLLFLFIIHRIMIRPLDRVMQERQFFLLRLNEEIEEAGEEYDQIREEIRSRELEARDTAQKIRDEIEAVGQKAAMDMIARTKEEINAMKSAAQKETADKLDVALTEAKKEAGAVADRMIALLLDRKVEA